MRNTIQIISMAVMLSASTGASTAQPVKEVRFAREVVPILLRRCVSCHNSDDPMGGLSLIGDVAYGQLIGLRSSQSPLMRVVPRAPGKSYLMAKLDNAQNKVGGYGFRMPMGFSQMTPGEIETVRRWIAQGAKND
jgi:uncharacterized membrane protein